MNKKKVVFHDLLKNTKCVIHESCDSDECEIVIHNDMESWIDDHTTDTETNFSVDFVNKHSGRMRNDGSYQKEACWYVT